MVLGVTACNKQKIAAAESIIKELILFIIAEGIDLRLRTRVRLPPAPLKYGQLLKKILHFLEMQDFLV